MIDHSTFTGPILLGLCCAVLNVVATPETDKLAAELHNKGWIAYSARTSAGDWDLFLMRPDGSDKRALTQTPEWSEIAPQFSRDGGNILFRRLKKEEKIEANRYGEQGIPSTIRCDGSGLKFLGEEGSLPWASWSPDGKSFATLSIKGVALIDAETGKAKKSFPRRGYFQQLTWSPDGEWLSGVANSFGTGWSIARMNANTGEIMPVNKVDCCTPDWFPNSKEIIFSWRPPGQKGNQGQGWTQLWRADAEGKNRQLVYGEDGRHVYGGHVSPDGQYVLFTGNFKEDGDPQNAGAPMAVMRLQDGPMIRGESSELKALHPQSKTGPVLELPSGWEPCWTASDCASSSATPKQHPNP